jgi:excisionase family DNA binding protein
MSGAAEWTPPGRGEVLTVKEAAAVARVSPATIRRWCRHGYLAAFQVGRGAAIRIPAAELRALLTRLEDESG